MSEQSTSRWRNRTKAIASLGLVSSAIYKLQKLRTRITRVDKPFSLTSRYARFPLKCRPGTSDMDVFDQIFVDREYRCMDDVRDPGLIIDCGANVGYSSAYFLSRFPMATVIAVEPDQGNYALLEENLRPYRSRWRGVRSAIWSRPTGLVMSEQRFRDGREWARTVRETKPGEAPTMMATDIGTLLQESAFDRISILKIDIEGAESVVFSSNYENWLDKVDTLVIELHGAAHRAVFMKAIAASGFDVSECDELTVCKRL